MLLPLWMRRVSLAHPMGSQLDWSSQQAWRLRVLELMHSGLGVLVFFFNHAQYLLYSTVCAASALLLDWTICAGFWRPRVWVSLGCS